MRLLVVVGVLCACGDNVEVTARVTVQPVRVLADGRTRAEIVVRLADRAGGPIGRQRVELIVNGTENQLEPAELVTDDAGVAVATLRSTTGGIKTIRANAGGATAVTEVEFDARASACTPRFGLPLVSHHARLAADLDGDGKRDLITTERESGRGIGAALGRGDGTFGSTIVSAYGSTLVPLTTGDLDHDGKPDLVAATYPGPSIVAMRGNGTGSFATPVMVTGTGHHFAAIGDIDADGRRDLVLAGVARIEVHFGRGDGTFDTPAIIQRSVEVGAIAVGDFDGDGGLDLLLAGGTTNLLSITGAARVVSTRTFAGGGGRLAVGDFNADSHLDFVDGYGVRLGTGTGNFGEEIVLPAPYMLLGDFAGDAGADLILIEDSPRVMTWSGDDFIAAFAVALQGLPMWSADFDGNGKADLVTLLEDASAVTLTDAGFQQPKRIFDDAYRAVAGDFDNDGQTDLVTATRDAITVSLTANLGSGTFGTIETHNTKAWPVGTGDFDRDGRLDVVLVEDPTDAGLFNEIGIALARDGMWLGSRTRYTLVEREGRVFNVQVADLDADGRLDLVATTMRGPSGSQTLQVLRGNGDGTFRTPETYMTEPLDTQQLVVADLDNDGHKDVVAVGARPSSSGRIVWWRGRPDGTLEPVADWYVSTQYSFFDWMLVDEIDGVPGVDLLVHPALRKTALLFRGDRQGRPTLDLPSAGTDARLVDVDRDGVLDLLTADGDGTFVSRGMAEGKFQPMTSFHGWAAIADDFDRDGKVDFVSPSFHLVETSCN